TAAGVDLLGDATTTNNTVLGNYIGADATGAKPLGNADGVTLAGGATGNVIGGAAAGSANVLSGNTDAGLLLGGAINSAQGNLIGTDRTGAAALGNAGSGVSINASGATIGGTAAGAGNVISANAVGITVAADAVQVVGNLIGTNAAGAAALGNTGDGLLITF